MAEKTVAMKQETNPAQTGEQTRSEARYVAPPVDIYEEGEKLVVIADLPGADKDSISVDVKDGILTLQAASKPNAPGNSLYGEFEFVNYYRQFELSETVDIEKIAADYKHGVLMLHLPKAEKAKPRKIEVKVA